MKMKMRITFDLTVSDVVDAVAREISGYVTGDGDLRFFAGARTINYAELESMWSASRIEQKVADKLRMYGTETAEFSTWMTTTAAMIVMRHCRSLKKEITDNWSLSEELMAEIRAGKLSDDE